MDLNRLTTVGKGDGDRERGLSFGRKGYGRSFYYVNSSPAERCYIFMYLYTFGNMMGEVGRGGGEFCKKFLMTMMRDCGKAKWQRWEMEGDEQMMLRCGLTGSKLGVDAASFYLNKKKWGFVHLERKSNIFYFQSRVWFHFIHIYWILN